MAKYYHAYQIEGPTGTLKSIDGAILGDRDLCWVKTTQHGDLTYIGDADSGLTENIPNVVAPTNNAGDFRWILNPTDE